MFRFKYSLSLLLLFLVSISTTGGYIFSSPSLNRNAYALQSSFYTWSDPILLFQIERTGEIHNPFIISDAYGNVHVFWAVNNSGKGEYDKIFYSRLDASGWTAPVDIIAASTARAISATISQDDFIYLIWNDGPGISYSRAPIQGAEFVRNWSTPIRITNSYPDASITTAPSGNIYLAYGYVSGVFERVLEPNKIEWSSPITVASNSLPNTGSDYVQIRVSKDGMQHVVWTEFYEPQNWPPRGVFYARSPDGGDTWSAPTLLAGDGYDQVNIAMMDDNNIHVVWNGMITVGGRYHRWSSDEGQTWSDTLEIIPAGIAGTSGYPQIVIDQTGTVHALVSGIANCATYSYFSNQRWSDPKCVATVEGSVEEPVMALSEGNKLHVVFWEDRKKLWYSATEIDAPWIQPKVMANELTQPASNPISSSTPIIVPTNSAVDLTALPLEQQLDTSGRANFNPGQVLFLGLSPVILLLIVIVLSQSIKKIK